LDALALDIGDRPTNLHEAQERLIHFARDTVARADHASLTVWYSDKNRFETPAATDSIAMQLDLLQYELGEGPCYDAVTQSDTIVVTGDLHNDSRWPTFSSRSAGAGMHSQLAVRVRGGRVAAGLNLYSSQASAFTEPLDDVRLIARCSSIVLAFAREITDLSNALQSRTVIGQAIGIIMERYTMDEKRAFSFLSTMSQSTNVKIRDIAADLVSGQRRRTNAQPSLSRPTEFPNPSQNQMFPSGPDVIPKG
jgi:hypothetical protein